MTYEESITFSYFSRNQTEAIKQMVAGESVVVSGFCRMVLGYRARGLVIFLGVSDVEILMGGGAGVVDGDSSERCLSGVVGSLRSPS